MVGQKGQVNILNKRYGGGRGKQIPKVGYVNYEQPMKGLFINDVTQIRTLFTLTFCHTFIPKFYASVPQLEVLKTVFFFKVIASKLDKIKIHCLVTCLSLFTLGKQT